ncbi:MAG: DUF1287 domain-containing protein [Clostridia bacterium]|nr:DUF1287 domain-containing protein [Clostridia bacterium]
MREIGPFKGRARIFLWAALAASVIITAFFAVRAFRFASVPHSASDFGFEDEKSRLDADGDGIDDWTDMVAGARAYIATDPEYKSAYYAGGYPDEGEGVCTDVIWRAFAAAGYTLKDLVDADVAADRSAYFGPGESSDSNINFRRVRHLLVFFERNAERLTLSQRNPRDWMPGDIVVFDGHIGICSDVRNASGIPYIIHHPDNVRRACEADDIGLYEIVGHFRWK